MNEVINDIEKVILDEMYKLGPHKLYNINLFDKFQQFSRKDIKRAIETLISIGSISASGINQRHMDFFYENFNGFFTDKGILEYESYDFEGNEKFSIEFIRLLDFLEESEETTINLSEIIEGVKKKGSLRTNKELENLYLISVKYICKAEKKTFVNSLIPNIFYINNNYDIITHYGRSVLEKYRNYKKYKNKMSRVFPEAMFIGQKLIANQLLEKIVDYFEYYGEISFQKAKEKALNFRALRIFKPSNYLIVINNTDIILYKSFSNVSLGNPVYSIWDDREKESKTIEEYGQIASQKFGYEDTYFFPLPAKILSMEQEEAYSIIKFLAERNFDEEYFEIINKHTIPTLSKEQINSFMENASEDEFTKLFVAPLLAEISFRNIKIKGHRERILEFGQDIKIMKFKLPTNHYLYFVAQIKTGDITISTSNVEKSIQPVLTEIIQSFEKDIFDDEINKSITPDHVYLITSGKIGEQARLYLEEQLEKQNRKILHLDKEKLIELYFSNGLPERDHNEIKKFLQELESADNQS